MREELWLALEASFGPILKARFPGFSALERHRAAEALADEVRKREAWFAPSSISDPQHIKES